MRPEPDYFEEERLGRTYDLRLLQRLAAFVRPHRRSLLASIGLVVAITLLELALPVLTQQAIDRYIVPAADRPGNDATTPAAGRRLRIDLSDPAAAEAVSRHPELAEIENGTASVPYAALAALPADELSRLRGGDLAGLARLTALFVLLVLADFALNFAQAVIMEATGQRIMHGLRMRLFDHIQGLALAYFTRNPVGRLVTRVTSDVQNMYELFTSFVSFVFKDLVLLAGIAGVMLGMNWRLALVTFSILPIVVVGSLSFARRARALFRALRVQTAEINTRFAETIGGMSVIQLFRREGLNFERFARLNRENYVTGMEQIRVLAVFMPMVEVVAAVAVALIVWYGGGEVLRGSLSLGALVAFIAYIRMFFRPLRDLAEKYNILQNAMASAERIFLVLDTENPMPRPAPRPGEPPTGPFEELRFEEVDFGYLPGERVLKGVGFAVRRGETVAVVGPTGAGKTSLVNLVPRLYDPTGGRVLLNGRDLRTLPAEELRGRMALVMQDALLFSGTVRENIFQGAAPPTRAEEQAVLAASNLERLVARLPAGLDTPLGEAGGSISSGERQLIAIARAFARDPELILFDEATSAIDSQTERWIQEALERLMRRRTALVIAHRLSTVRHADRILVLNRGRIVESGTHAHLMGLGGFYFRLHQLQPASAVQQTP